jgi:hypothetical protein
LKVGAAAVLPFPKRACLTGMITTDDYGTRRGYFRFEFDTKPDSIGSFIGGLP